METVNRLDEFVVDNMVDNDVQLKEAEDALEVKLDVSKKEKEDELEEELAFIDEILEINNNTIFELLNAA